VGRSTDVGIVTGVVRTRRGVSSCTKWRGRRVANMDAGRRRQ